MSMNRFSLHDRFKIAIFLNDLWTILISWYLTQVVLDFLVITMLISKERLRLRREARGRHHHRDDKRVGETEITLAREWILDRPKHRISCYEAVVDFFNPHFRSWHLNWSIWRTGVSSQSNWFKKLWCSLMWPWKRANGFWKKLFGWYRCNFEMS